MVTKTKRSKSLGDVMKIEKINIDYSRKYPNSSTLTLPFKLVLLGKSDVGKSSMVIRLTNDSFDGGTDPTVGAAFATYTTCLDSECFVKFSIWDTAGDETYRELHSLYYTGAHAVMIIYDITKQSTFGANGAKYWIHQLQRYIRENPKSPPQLILVGNKTDLSHERVISEKEGQKMAKYDKMMFYETSAKTGRNVKEMFDDIAKELGERRLQNMIEYPEPSEISPPKESPKKKKNRCWII